MNMDRRESSAGCARIRGVCSLKPYNKQLLIRLLSQSSKLQTNNSEPEEEAFAVQNSTRKLLGAAYNDFLEDLVLWRAWRDFKKSIRKRPSKLAVAGTLSYEAGCSLHNRSSTRELIQNRKGVERTASDQKRKIDRAQGRETQRSSAL